MPKKYKKPTIAQIKQYHYRIIKNQGQEYLALPKSKEEHLESILESMDQYVFGEDLYPTICDKAIYLLMRIEQSQAFPDGNKRVALSAFEHFLNMNGSSINSSISQKMKERFMLSIATNKIDKVNSVDCCIKGIK